MPRKNVLMSPLSDDGGRGTTTAPPGKVRGKRDNKKRRRINYCPNRAKGGSARR